MSPLPDALAEQLRASLQARVDSALPVGGGMVNKAARIETPDGPLFVKWQNRPLPDLFRLEADGLERLRHTGSLRVPHVVAYQDAREGSDCPAYLALEWIDEDAPRDRDRFSREFAEALAALHRTPAPATFGLDTWNYLGAVRQDNTPTESWPEFYRDCRVIPQIEAALSKRLLTPARERSVRDLAEAIPALLNDMEPSHSLIHGDLWSGNYLPHGYQAVVIDPAVYVADREVEMAYVQLFGGFPPRFVEWYHEAYPLADGYEHRRPLHQLYPLLIHLNHFGETYGPPVEEVCRHYGF